MKLNVTPTLFSESALLGATGLAEREGLLQWIRERRAAHRFDLTEIPFKKLRRWSFDAQTGDLRHDTGGFFSISGVEVRTNWGSVSEWDQPIVDQPEVGFLGFITKRFSGVLHFLAQAKMEPGNVGMVQLAPTLQATRSNFTRVHEGKTPPYLEFFSDESRCRVLVDSLESEQGARFLRKRNRNIVVETDEEIDLLDDYRWMTLGQIMNVMQVDNTVNMDARSVLSSIPLDAATLTARESPVDRFREALVRSFDRDAPTVQSVEEIISWFTRQKFAFELNVQRKPLKHVRNWVRNETSIRHEADKYFSVIACAVEADSREVAGWTQPMVKARQRGLVAFVVKEFGGVLHILVQGKVEPGNFDVVEMAPTVQCITGSYSLVPEGLRPPFVQYVLCAPKERVLSDSLQSEEGGRFFREANRNIVVEAGDDFPDTYPDNYIWVSVGQLKGFIKFNNFVNVQARCLLSVLTAVIGGAS